MRAHPAAVRELIEVLDRFAEISGEAATACAATDVTGVERALEARDVVLTRARELLPLLPPSLPATIREKLDRLADADRALVATLSQALETIRTQLDDVGAQVSRVGGYAATMPRIARLDTLR